MGIPMNLKGAYFASMLAIPAAVEALAYDKPPTTSGQFRELAGQVLDYHGRLADTMRQAEGRLPTLRGQGSFRPGEKFWDDYRSSPGLVGYQTQFRVNDREISFLYRRERRLEAFSVVIQDGCLSVESVTPNRGPYGPNVSSTGVKYCPEARDSFGYRVGIRKQGSGAQRHLRAEGEGSRALDTSFKERLSERALEHLTRFQGDLPEGEKLPTILENMAEAYQRLVVEKLSPAIAAQLEHGISPSRGHTVSTSIDDRAMQVSYVGGDRFHHYSFDSSVQDCDSGPRSVRIDFPITGELRGNLGAGVVSLAVGGPFTKRAPSFVLSLGAQRADKFNLRQDGPVPRMPRELEQAVTEAWEAGEESIRKQAREACRHARDGGVTLLEEMGTPLSDRSDL